MDKYQVYDVKIRKDDREKADAILWKHYDNGDFDDITIGVITSYDREGNDVITYRIAPYLYEDFETIKKEFKEAGIRII